MSSTAIQLQSETAQAFAKAPPNTSRKNLTYDQARKVAQDFEAFFLGQSLQPMFSSLDSAPPFGGGQAESMWRSMQVDEYGKAIARSGGIGIADAIVSELLKSQEI
ncbi:MAG: rod-binding protein [Rhodospirillales bacterium]|nr:rod-binding protein [Rhodospirillales bacterium]